MGDKRNTFFGGYSTFRRTLDTIQGGTEVKDFRAVNVGEGNSCAWHNCSLFPVILSLNKKKFCGSEICRFSAVSFAKTVGYACSKKSGEGLILFTHVV